ncbi:MAG TPA: hypothetical protein DE147_09645 [Gammaproteobacteria bacterium]|nr:hypothetical protein [Gammaproteobacteria bacterium]
MRPQSKRKNVIYFPAWIDIESEFGVLDYARKAGWFLHGLASHGGNIEALRNQLADGLVTMLFGDQTALGRYADQLQIPVVDMGSDARASNYPKVVQDDHAIVAMGAQHLLERGIRHITFLKHRSIQQQQVREQALRAIIASTEATYYPIDFGALRHGSDRMIQKQKLLATLLQELPKPLGVMLNYDKDLPVVTEACQLAGLSIPNDIVVTSMGNNIALCELGEMPLTSVDVNHRLHGYRAAELLDRLMHGETPPTEPMLIPPSHLVVRRSSDMYATADTTLQAALSFLADNASDPSVNVDDVVRASPSSRRKLYSLFQHELGRGISEVLTDMRLEEAQHLLLDTDLKIVAVAHQAGFSGHASLVRTFTRKTGLTPIAFRRRAQGDSWRQYNALYHAARV